jgi:flagellar biogenesis protein FliO
MSQFWQGGLVAIIAFVLAMLWDVLKGAYTRRRDLRTIAALLVAAISRNGDTLALDLLDVKREREVLGEGRSLATALRRLDRDALYFSLASWISRGGPLEVANTLSGMLRDSDAINDQLQYRDHLKAAGAALSDLHTRLTTLDTYLVGRMEALQADIQDVMSKPLPLSRRAVRKVGWPDA